MKIPTLEPVIKLLGSAVSKANALLREQSSLEKAETELREQIDAAERSGSVNDDKLISKLATDRARLSMFPAKLTQLDSEIVAAIEGIKPPLNHASSILGQHAADTRVDVTAQLHKLLSPLVDNAATRQAMIDLCLEEVAAVCEVRALAGTFSSMAIYEYAGEKRLPELAGRLVQQFAQEQPA